jgi:hypothetical protein
MILTITKLVGWALLCHIAGLGILLGLEIFKDGITINKKP